MTKQANAAIIHRLAEEVWSNGKTATLDELYEPDGHSQSRQELKEAVTTLRTGLPDLQMTIEDVVAAGTALSVRWSMYGTHTGHCQALSAQDALAGRLSGGDAPVLLVDLPPTHRQVRIQGLSLYHLRNGRIVSHATYIDQLGLMRQLGAMPLPSPTSMLR